MTITRKAERSAVYAGTRNYYLDMIPSAKSLLVHSDVDRIYFLIEDDAFPIELPDCFTIINVRDQKWFNPVSANWRVKWTYMVLLRAAYAKIFPDLDKIVSLDGDTIVGKNIGSELWDLDLGENFFAAACEPTRSNDRFTYFNMGVAVYNLKQIREEGLDDILINSLNTTAYKYAEQDCINEWCQGRILELNSRYNRFAESKPVEDGDVRILHFAASDGTWRALQIVHYYMNLSWDQVFEMRRRNGQKNRC